MNAERVLIAHDRVEGCFEVLHVDTADVARPPLFEDLDEERPELLRQYRTRGDLAAPGWLDDGDKLQDMRAKRFQALVDLQRMVTVVPLNEAGGVGLTGYLIDN